MQRSREEVITFLKRSLPLARKMTQLSFGGDP